MAMLQCQIPGRDYSRSEKSARGFGTEGQGTCLCNGTHKKNRESCWKSYQNLAPDINVSTGAVLRGLYLDFFL